MPLYYPPTQNFLQKTLGSTLAAGATVATLNNTTALQNKPLIFIVDRIDANGVETPSKREVISASGISGSTVTSLTRGLAGTSDQEHAVGAIIEFVPDVLQQQALIDALANLVDPSTLAIDTTKLVTPTGTQTLTNKTIDGDDNTVQDIPASALKVASQAQGDILYFNGTAWVRLGAGTDGQVLTTNGASQNPAWEDATTGADSEGWFTSSDTWTYATANTFTIAGVDRTNQLRVGTKIRLTQTTDKYFIVGAVSFSTNTTVTIEGGTDYTLANAAITSPKYSYDPAPDTFPSSITWNGRLYGSGGSAGTYAQTSVTAEFYTVGRVCYIWSTGKVTNKGSWSGSVYFALPDFLIPASVLTVGGGGDILPEGGLNTMRARATNVNNSPGNIVQFNSTFLTAELSWTNLQVNDCWSLSFAYSF